MIHTNVEIGVGDVVSIIATAFDAATGGILCVSEGVIVRDLAPEVTFKISIGSLAAHIGVLGGDEVFIRHTIDAQEYSALDLDRLPESGDVDALRVALRFRSCKVRVSLERAGVR